MQIFSIIIYQSAIEKSLHVVAIVFKSVVGVTTTTPTKPVNSVLVVPNDLAFPSQVMEVDVVAAISKLIRITTITPFFEGAFILVVVVHVSIIANKQDNQHDSHNDTKK